MIWEHREYPLHISVSTWIEIGVEGPIGIQPGDAITHDATYMSKCSADQNFAVRLDGDRLHLTVRIWSEQSVQSSSSAWDDPGKVRAWLSTYCGESSGKDDFPIHLWDCAAYRAGSRDQGIERVEVTRGGSKECGEQE